MMAGRYSPLKESSTDSNKCFIFILLQVRIYCENRLCLLFLILTLKPPQLQHHSAALQVVEQALGGVQGGKVYSVIQHGVDVVPHGRGEQILAAVKQPETGRTQEEEAESRISTVPA